MLDEALPEPAVGRERTSGLRGRLILAIGAVAALTLAAGGFGIWSYQKIEQAFQAVADHSIPAMIDAFDMVERASSLTSDANALATATTAAEHAKATGRIADDNEAFRRVLDHMAASSLPSKEVGSTEVLAGELAAALGELDRMVSEELSLADERRMAVETIEAAHAKLLTWLEPKIDEANFDLVIQAEETTSGLGDQIESLMTDGVGRLQSALMLRAETNRMAGILIEAVVLADPAEITEAEDRFIAVANAVDEELALLRDLEGGDDLARQIDALRNLGQGDDGVFAGRRRLADSLSDETTGGRIDHGWWAKAIFGPREAILALLEPIVDEARFDLVLLSESAVDDSSKTINELIDRSVSSLRGYLGVAADSNWLVGLLQQASIERDVAVLATLSEQINSAVARLHDLQGDGVRDPKLLTELEALTAPILAMASGEGSIPELRGREIDMRHRQELKVEEASELAGALATSASRLVDLARSNVGSSSALVESAIASGRWLMAALSIAALLGSASVVIFYVGPRIVDPLRAMSSSISRLAQGEQVAIEGMDRKDELGELARSLTIIHEKAIEASRIKLALDNANAGVMVADGMGKIVYVNRQLSALFQAAEAEIRHVAPDFQAGDLVGLDVDELQQSLGVAGVSLKTLRAADEVECKVAGRHLAFVASPVLGASGERLGSVIEWRDHTEDLALQRSIDEVVSAAVGGDFSKRVKADNLDGAMGRLAQGVDQLTGLIEGATGDIGTMLGALAEGDLSRRITADYRGTLGVLKDDANRTADQLANIVGHIQLTANEVKNAASEITSGTEDLSSRTEQAAANLEETAASTEEMAATVGQNAKNAKSASELAGSADRTAKTGGDVVKQAVGAMAGIEESAQKITDIISVIDEIAFQTNLLALNASVEAARAGEAGKGFAVVAQEVRQLAQRSAQAAADIKTLIQNSNGQVKDGVQLVNRAGEALTEIVGSIGKVAGIVEQISSASQEQAIGVQEINNSITSMDEMTQQNSALVEESTAAARALTDQATKLAELMAFFKLDGSKTLARSKAGHDVQRKQVLRSALLSAGHEEV
ncbi:MAG: methyl-accepting chemotaxis protein [Alphaproteobacteria bacterium]